MIIRNRKGKEQLESMTVDGWEVKHEMQKYEEAADEEKSNNSCSRRKRKREDEEEEET